MWKNGRLALWAAPWHRAAAVAIVLGLALYAYGNGREQGALYRQMLMQNAAIMGP